MPWTTFDTAIGSCGLAWTDAGLTHVQLPETTAERTAETLLARAPAAGERATKKTTPGWVADAIAKARAHLDGKPQDLSAVPLDLTGVSEFSRKVYRALQRVPAGEAVTYGELAGVVGSPGASRAVGTSMAKNPVPIFVPCQRVLAAGGKPGGFSAPGGLATKERMLVIEGWRPTPQAPLFAGAGGNGLPYDGALARRTLVEADRVLAAHIDRVGDFTLGLKATEGTFAALAESIVYQQISGKAAGTIFGRLRALLPKGKLDPRALLALDDEVLRWAGISSGKLAALRDLAERAARGDVPTLAQLARMDDDAIVDKLTEVRGVGRWTVEMLLVFRLGRPDVLPIADYGIKKGFARVFHKGAKKEELPTVDDLARRGERWRPYRSVASWYLWRALDSE